MSSKGLYFNSYSYLIKLKNGSPINAENIQAKERSHAE